ncbi:MAG: hypothetical protein AB9897_01230 [Anaerolineaceae bacterium]
MKHFSFFWWIREIIFNITYSIYTTIIGWVIFIILLWVLLIYVTFN